MDNIIYWRRKWQPSPGFFPGESHGQRSLMGYSPWGSKESDVTERLTLHYTHIQASLVAQLVKKYIYILQNICYAICKKS